MVADQLQHRGAGFSGSGGDGGADEGFVIELVCRAVIELKDAVFAHGVIAFRGGPSRIGMQAGE